ncbi:MAG: hypothetical protein AAGE52_01495 [Myxococcota bacterium]
MNEAHQVDAVLADNTRLDRDHKACWTAAARVVDLYGKQVYSGPQFVDAMRDLKRVLREHMPKDIR